MRPLVRVISSCCLLFVISLPLLAETIYVDVDATGADDGSTWLDAFTDLQDALAIAEYGDELWIAGGTYYPTDGLDQTISFELVSGVALYGGFSGVETDTSQRDWALHETILSGDIGEPDPVANIFDLADELMRSGSKRSDAMRAAFAVSSGGLLPPRDNSRVVVISHGVDANTILDGLKITGGGRSVDQSGNPNGQGGMLNEDGSLTLNHIVFTNNSAAGDIFHAGGMTNRGVCDLTLTDVRFERNGSAYGCGGMLFSNGGLVLQDVVFRQNWALYVVGGLQAHGDLEFENVLFERNEAEDAFSGAAFSGTGTIDKISFIDNLSPYGTVACSGQLAIQNIVFEGNSHSSGWGDNELGILQLNGDDLTLANVLFVNNYYAASYYDGALTISGSPRLTNLTIADNSSSHGTAIRVRRGWPRITNLVFWGNQTEFDEPVIRIDGEGLTFSHSIIQGSGGSGSDWDPAFGTDGGGNIDADPRFVGFDVGNFQLGERSPAIDAGDNAALPPDVLLDLAGNPRIVGPAVDMGAYEYVGPPPSPMTIYVDADASGSDNGLSWDDAFTDLQDAIALAIAGDEIWVAEGIYLPSSVQDVTESFHMVNGVGIYGGFAGDEVARDQRDWEANETLLSGQLNPSESSRFAQGPAFPNGTVDMKAMHDALTSWSQDVLRQEGKREDVRSEHVVRADAVGGLAVLDGFTITQGMWGSGGAGMLLFGASPTITNVIFRSNGLTDRGGGMAMYEGSDATLKNVLFENNYAWFGGALYARDSAPTLTDVRFYRNYSISDYGAASIRTSSGTVHFDNVSFIQNVAGDGVGGFSNVASLVYIGGLFQDNYTENFEFGGMVTSGTTTLVNVLFSGNLGYGCGGGLTNGGDIELFNVGFVDNISVGGGCDGSGGGMYSAWGNVSLVNATFAGNYADRSGDGLRISDGHVTIKNSVFWGNEGGGGYPEEEDVPISIGAGTVGISNSLVQGCGGSGAAWNPAFGTGL